MAAAVAQAAEASGVAAGGYVASALPASTPTPAGEQPAERPSRRPAPVDSDSEEELTPEQKKSVQGHEQGLG